jgi:hypothetical protein
MPLSYYATLLVFTPKGDSDGDAALCAREFADARPLALMNSDRKTSAAVLNSVCSRVFSEGLDIPQNGFTRGRRFVNNVVDLDGHA